MHIGRDHLASCALWEGGGHLGSNSNNMNTWAFLPPSFPPSLSFFCEH